MDVVALATLVFLLEEQLPQGRASGGHRGAPD
jgi:hypothetical protein